MKPITITEEQLSYREKVVGRYRMQQLRHQVEVSEKILFIVVAESGNFYAFHTEKGFKFIGHRLQMYRLRDKYPSHIPICYMEIQSNPFYFTQEHRKQILELEQLI